MLSGAVPLVCLQEVSLMIGKHTAELAALLGYHTDGELIHRGNLALLLPGASLYRTACVIQGCSSSILAAHHDQSTCQHHWLSALFHLSTA
jgi:hypothetical protein